MNVVGSIKSLPLHGVWAKSAAQINCRNSSENSLICQFNVECRCCRFCLLFAILNILSIIFLSQAKPSQSDFCLLSSPIIILVFIFHVSYTAYSYKEIKYSQKKTKIKERKKKILIKTRWSKQDDYQLDCTAANIKKKKNSKE